MDNIGFLHPLSVSPPAGDPSVSTEVNIFIVENNGHVVLIDAGYENPDSRQLVVHFLQHLSIEKIEGIIITHHHADHAAGAKTLSQQLNCPIFCHRLEQKKVRQHLHPDQLLISLEDGDQIKVGELKLNILHTPGHTAGHISLWLEEAGLLFAGDNLVSPGTTWIGPPDGNLSQYLNTLYQLQKLSAKVIAPGHGPLIREPAKKIQTIIDRRLERERQIMHLLTASPQTVSQLVTAIYKNRVQEAYLWAAERTIQGHLEKLVNEGKIVHAESDLYQVI